MRYQSLQEAIREITESHVSDLQFYSGLKSGFDTANNVNFPAIVFVPPSFDMPIDNEAAQAHKVWKIHLEAWELLSTESTDQEKEEAFDRTCEYLKDVVLQFWTVYGYPSKTVTVGNVTDTLDFTISSVPSFVGFQDEQDNITGWMVDFEITEGLEDDVCHLPSVFS